MSSSSPLGTRRSGPDVAGQVFGRNGPGSGSWPPPTDPIRCVQPGESGVFLLERLWGRWRRAWLRRFRAGYVARLQALRRGDCPGCVHDILDPRDLKLYRNVCGYRFEPADDPFRWRDRLPFARMGLAEVVVLGGGGLLLALVLAFLAPAWSAVPLAFALFVGWFFRDPRRSIPADPTAVLSPSDGVVDDIVELPRCPVLGVPVLRVGISLSLFNVHLNRTPMQGQVVSVHYFRGRFRNAMRKGDHSQNEQLWTVYQPDWIAGARLAEPAAEDARLAVRQIAGPVARRIVCEVRPGQRLAAGQPFGMIKFGSRTELYLPLGSAYELLARRGQRVRGGMTILARAGRWPHAAGDSRTLAGR